MEISQRSSVGLVELHTQCSYCKVVKTTMGSFWNSRSTVMEGGAQLRNHTGGLRR